MVSGRNDPARPGPGRGRTVPAHPGATRSPRRSDLAIGFNATIPLNTETEPDATARKRLRRAGAEHPDAPVRCITLRQSVGPSPDDDRGARDTAGRIYWHRWFVRPHRRARLDHDDDPTGYPRKWVGPYLVTPEGCEDGPDLGQGTRRRRPAPLKTRDQVGTSWFRLPGRDRRRSDPVRAAG
ncbi:hypothetical protein GCM10010507_10310 [Streptomyces cinnamoneus]|uniref:Uncharacterized protein n=1 Tax=Streptomyces cinnamoneus TaxID=53446 RepID=A0A918WEH2_STRCJ|nr:hypothetical protein GCM10010507_10310 [Streptomyces cinnamoneus]